MNIGLIGCGYIANAHMMSYKKIRNANVVAVSDTDLKKAKILAEKYGIQKSFNDYMDLIEINDLDVVDICTPTSTHAKIACDAAKFGRNILVEKPMATSTSECERMILESKKHGGKLCVCHNQLFLPSIQQAKSMVESGNYDLTSFRTSQKESFELLKALDLVRSWNVTPEEKGILWEVGCHLAYLQLHFLQNVKEVYALGNKVKYPVYDEFMVLLRTPSQRFGIIEISWVAKETEVVYEINCSDGKRVQIYPEYGYLLEKSENPPESIASTVRNIYSDEKRFFRKWMKFGLNFLRKGKLAPHFNLIDNYIKSLENDSSPPVQPEEGKNTIRLLECIEESLKGHRAVALTF